MISDGFSVAHTAAIEIDFNKMTDHECFYVQRALLKGAIRVVQYEVIHQDNEVSV